MRPRAVIELDLGLGALSNPGIEGVNLFSARVLLGYRVQLRQRFGWQVRAGARLGLAQFVGHHDDTWQTVATDRTAVAALLVEVMPFAGPFGRFYLGPLAQLGYVTYGKNTLHSGVDTWTLDDGLTVGAGLHGGIVFFDTERTVLHFSTVVAKQSALALLASVGVGFHF